MLVAFEDPLVGQWGPIAAGDEEWTSIDNWPVGGHSVIRSSLGLRYSEKPWTEGGILEDHQLTLDVWVKGYKRVFSQRPYIIHLDDGDQEYKFRTSRDRGLL
jgi:hypothetical protein